jgi:hypothetical protein
MLRLWLVCVLTGMPVAATAQIFECTNAAGGKQYSSFCPPGTVQQRQIAKGSEATGESPSANPAAPAKSRELQDAEFKQRMLERQEADIKAAQSKAQADEFDRNCLEARVQLQAVLDGQRMVRFDPVTGERIQFGDAERTSEAERQRTAISRWCQ